MPNYNPETGIAYGVAALNGLADWVFDEFFDHGTNVTFEAAEADYRAENGLGADDEIPQEWYDEYESDEEAYELETADGLKLGLDYLGGAALVWVFESPHTVEAPACSPCVPGAGDLDSIGGRSSGGTIRCYTLPAEWRASE